MRRHAVFEFHKFCAISDKLFASVTCGRVNTVCPTRYRTQLAGGPLLRVATIRRTTETLQTHSFSFLPQRTYSCSNFVAIS